jgi:hypothetical protein
MRLEAVSPPVALNQGQVAASKHHPTCPVSGLPARRPRVRATPSLRRINAEHTGHPPLELNRVQGCCTQTVEPIRAGHQLLMHC